MADVGETDFAVIVFREEDHWEADALPAVVTVDLDDFVQAPAAEHRRHHRLRRRG